jgi:uncharacterized protein (DUF305 family)
MRAIWILAVLLLTACASAPPAVAPSTPVPAATGAVTTDIAWTQLMIALDEKILTVLELAPAQSTNAKVITLASDLAAQHRNEISTLRANLSLMGALDDNPHAGHEMPGMVTAASFAKLAAAKGSAFDQLLAVSLREHLDQCVSLARSELKSGTDNATLALAASVEKNRAANLARLQEIAA